MKRRAVIGIDNGLKGGICALCPESGEVIAHMVMPLREFLGKEEADIGKVVGWISHFDCYGVGIEEPPKHLNSIQSMRSMALSFGLLTGALQQAGLAPCRITVQEWQKKLLGKVPQGHTKPYALAKAKELWPAESWLPGPRHRTPHDGLVDAALIARYLASWLEK